MRLAAIYIPEGILTHLFGDHSGITLNLGGKFVYNVSGNFKSGFQANREENDNFVDNFFGKGIYDLSAIVGSNGTGKTSLLNALRGRSFLKYIYEDEEGNIEFYHEPIETSDIIFYTPHFDYVEYDFEFDNFKDISTYRLMSEDLRFENLSLSDHMEIHYSENLKRWINFLMLSNVRQKLRKIKLPIFENVTIRFRKISIDAWQTSYNFRPFFREFVEIQKREDDEKFKVLRKSKKKNSEEPRRFGNKIRLESYIIMTIIAKVQSILESSGNKYLREGRINDNMTIASEEFTKIQTLKDSFYWFLEHSYIQLSKKSNKIYFPIDEIKKLLEVLISDLPEDEDIDNWAQYEMNFTKTKLVIDAYQKFLLAFKKDFTYDRKDFLTLTPDIRLSSGERGVYNLLSSLFDYQFRKDNNIDGDLYSMHNDDKPKNNHALILLDESDLGFHPQWKKEFVNTIVEVFPYLLQYEKIQVIFTTHDPLTLSDIPRSKIIYLDKSSDGYTFVNIDENNKRSFGANIYDLLASSFFLKDGFIGQFAQDTINDLVRYLTQDDKNEYDGISNEWRVWTENKAQKVINLIDEPLIKDRLQDLFNDKFKNHDKEQILLMIEDLQNRLKRMEDEEN